MSKTRFPTSEQTLLEAAIEASYAVRRVVKELLYLTPGRALEPTMSKDQKGRTKTVLYVDKQAENKCAAFLTNRIGEDKLLVLGEESIWQQPNLDLTGETRIVAILDMIDGSDLVEKELGNWCSAIVFFQATPVPKILCSVVQDASGKIYFAQSDGAYVIVKKTSKPVKMSKPTVPPLHKMSICFYGQKVKILANIPRSFYAWLETIDAHKGSTLRIYNLAGNPMMARLANSDHITVVFDDHGQYPHDVVPGAYIALKAGASLLDSSGERLTEKALAQCLLRPSGTKLHYVLARNAAIASAVAHKLWPST
jgi:fructose-1,6-bisphosphatase/inositol monophosphatase family enzyme